MTNSNSRGALLSCYLLVVIIVVLVVIGDVSRGDMARSGDSSHLPARRDDGAPSIFRQLLGVFVPALLHGSHVPAKRFHAGRKKVRTVVLAVGLPTVRK